MTPLAGRRLLLPAAIGLALAGCGHKRAPRRVAIEMTGMAFSPASVEVTAGDTVVWTNKDIVPHTATGTGFDTGTLGQGASFRFVPGRAGTLSYACTFHPVMTGEILVR